MLTVAQRTKLHCAVFIFKYLKIQTPAYLNDLFVVNEGRTRANGQLIPKRPKNTTDLKSFGHAAIKFWNTIPQDIIDLESLTTFKCRVKSWLLDGQRHN